MNRNHQTESSRGRGAAGTGLVQAILAACLVALQAVLPLASAAAQDLDLGEYVYAQRCAPCHGKLDVPSGPIDAERYAIPAYYAGHAYLLQLPPREIRIAILLGITGTCMTGFGGEMSPLALDSLVAYIESVRFELAER